MIVTNSHDFNKAVKFTLVGFGLFAAEYQLTETKHENDHISYKDDCGNLYCFYESHKDAGFRENAPDVYLMYTPEYSSVSLDTIKRINYE